VGKLSAMGQPTRPTQPSITLGWYISSNTGIYTYYVSGNN